MVSDDVILTNFWIMSKARRALRALKALVKLQALVRGHIVRKQTADMLKRMQTLVRLQDRARATRSLMSESVHSSSKSSLSYNPVSRPLLLELCMIVAFRILSACVMHF